LLAASCSRRSDEAEKLGQVRSSVPVRLERERTTGPNLGGLPKDGALGTLTRFHLIVDLATPLVVPIACQRWKVDVSVAPARDRFAYRCFEDQPWNVVFGGPAPPGYVEWRGAFGATSQEAERDGFPAWDRVPALADAAANMVLSGGAPSDIVLAAVRAQGGEAAVAEVLPKVVSMPLRSESAGRTDPWVEALRTMPAEARRPAVAALREALRKPGSGPGPVRRSLLVFDAGDESALDDLAERLREVDEAERRARPSGDVVVSAWQREALDRLMTARPRLAAVIGCARLERNRFDTQARRAAALGPCPHVTP
jgi:hypothetical protein